MNKHTPGPWIVVTSCKSKHREARFIKAENGGFVGKTYGHEGEPVEANAHLFAAAPKLLEVAIDGANALAAAITTLKEQGNSVNEQYDKTWLAMRAAIAKAKDTET